MQEVQLAVKESKPYEEAMCGLCSQQPSAARHLGYPVQVSLKVTELSSYCNCLEDLKQELLEPISNS